MFNAAEDVAFAAETGAAAALDAPVELFEAFECLELFVELCELAAEAVLPAPVLVPALLAVLGALVVAAPAEPPPTVITVGPFAEVVEPLFSPIRTPTPRASSSVAMPAIRVVEDDWDMRRRRLGGVACARAGVASAPDATEKRGLPRRSPHSVQ